MKKLLSMLLVLSLVLSLFAGCAKEAETETDTGSSKSETKKDDAKKDDGKKDDAAAADTALTLPLEETITMTAFVTNRPNVDDFYNNEFTKWLEEKTNIKLEFVVSPENESEEKLNLLLATGDYPDLIFSKKLNTAQQAYYGSQGVFIPLNDLIDQYGNYSTAAFDEYPIVKDMVTMPDGNIYNMPQINHCYHCSATQKLWIYEPWLEAVGMDMPETIDEFYAVLKAFKEQDPNGNGKADEVPLSGAIKGWEPNVEAFIMNAFVYNADKQNGGESLYVNNGQIAASYMDEGWKEGLKFLQKLRKEGLLDTNAFTQDNEALKQLGETPGDNILGVAPGGFMGNMSQIGGESGRWENWVTIPPLEGPEGVRTTKYNPFVNGSGVTITDKCENPEAAFLLIDLFYSEEATFRNTIGRPGIEWDYAPEGAKGLNGEQALWSELIPFNSQDANIGWNQLGPNFRSSSWRLGRQASEEQKLEVILYEETKNKYAPYFPSQDVPLPPLALSEEQSAALLQYSTSVKNYTEEKLAHFVLNDVDIDAEWPGYIAELEAMGINDMLSVWQEAYDAR